MTLGAPVSGLTNMGNTCYINAVLQILHNLDELNEYITKRTPHPIGDSIFPAEWIALKELMDKSVIINPQRFIHMNERLFQTKNKTEFLNHQQGDASEYMLFILEMIHNAYNLLETPPKSGCLAEIQKKDFSIITHLFSSVSEMVYEDLAHKVVSTKYESQWAIDLPIPDGAETLTQCLDLFFSEERLCDANQWYDDKTHQHKDVVRKTQIMYDPIFLVLNLKRWCGLKKNNKKIVYDSTLDLSKYSRNAPCYSLFGIINHIGNVRSGHYYAYVLKGAQWFSLNDTQISPISSEKLVCSSNYCLFYRKLK